jgi:hypothetical protein
LVSTGLLAQKEQPRKQDDNQKREILAAVKIVDDVAAGQAAPNEFGLTWVREDMMKALGNREYVPFVVTIDPSKVTGGSVALYWRVVKSNTPGVLPPPAPANGKKDDKDKKDNGKRPAYEYEDVTFTPIAGGTSGPLRIARSFTVAAGSYDVYVVAKEPQQNQKNAPAPKASLIKQTVTVPDFWSGDLTTSSVIVTQRIDPLAAPLTQTQQIERPYAMGGMELVPVSNNKFSKKDELQTFMLIYNPKTDMGKPNVTVEYNFCQASAGNTPKEGEPCKAGEKFFNKTNPQNLNAQTLPPAFDANAGHQLQSGQAVPLASFPEGEYRLEIKVTDKLGNKTVIRDVNFSVSAS